MVANKLSWKDVLKENVTLIKQSGFGTAVKNLVLEKFD